MSIRCLVNIAHLPRFYNLTFIPNHTEPLSLRRERHILQRHKIYEF
jgi:hypothetical protein